MKWLALAIVLVGCGPPTEAPYTYMHGPFIINSELALRPSGVAAYLDRAQSIFDRQFGEGEFERTLADRTITVRNADVWDCALQGPCIGFTNTNADVWLARMGGALLHEAIHAYEVRHLMAGTAWHEQWEEKGYDALSMEFASITLTNPWIRP